MADQTPFGAGIRSLIGNKKQLENNIVNQWIKYSKAFEYKDYETLANYFSFPVVFDALNEPEKIINKKQLIEKYKIIREDNIEEDYKYSILNKYNFIQLSDDFIILDAIIVDIILNKKIFLGEGFII